MELIKQWIINITALVLFIVLIEILLPNGKMKKYVGLATGTILVIAIISPILGLIGKNGDLSSLQIIDGNILDRMQVQYDSQLLEKEQMDQIVQVYRGKIINQIIQSTEEIDGVTCVQADIIFNEDYSSQTFGEIRRVFIEIKSPGEKDDTKVDEEDPKRIKPIAKVKNVAIGENEIEKKQNNDIDRSIKTRIIEKISGTFGVKAENIIISQSGE